MRRPVCRGLRHYKDEGPLFIGQLLKPHPCGIETRLQGIATCHARTR
jgi:hypothetical protein